jgi:hypothetical protein
MWALLLLIAHQAFALSQPSLGLALGTEDGQYGPDLTLDFHASALTVRGEQTTAIFLPLMVSWDFIADESRPKNLDRFEFGLLRTDRSIEDGKMVVGFTVLSASHDYDLAVIDATALGSDVSIFLVEDLVALGLGLDVRYRAHTVGDITRSATILHQQAVGGIPLSITAFSPPQSPWVFSAPQRRVESETTLRTGVALVF